MYLDVRLSNYLLKKSTSAITIMYSCSCCAHQANSQFWICSHIAFHKFDQSTDCLFLWDLYQPKQFRRDCKQEVSVKYDRIIAHIQLILILLHHETTSVSKWHYLSHVLESFNATQVTANSWSVYCLTGAPLRKFHNLAVLSLLAVTK